MLTFKIPKHQQPLLDTLAQLDPHKTYIVTIDEPHRSTIRNAQLHAVIREIAEQKQWDGEWLTVEQWKRLLVAAWMRATTRRVKLVRALDGSGIEPLYQNTRNLTEGETRELIQFIYAWAITECNPPIVFKEPTPEGWKYPEKVA